MPHRGLFSGTVKQVPKKKSAKKRSSRRQINQDETPAVPQKSKWGTPEEKYRRLCMLCLLCRMTYYVHSRSVISDQTYDELENTILEIENKHRHLLHPRSPTCWPGSSRVEEYPKSAQDLWLMHKDDGDAVWGAIEAAVVSFMQDARQVFELGDSKYQKNLEKSS